MLKKIDNFLFFGVHLVLYFFFLYGLTVYASDHLATLFFWIAGIVISLFEVIYRICNYHTNKRIKRYIENF